MEVQLLQQYRYDPEFTIRKLPVWRSRLYRFCSITLWGNLPSSAQRRLSASYATLFSKSFSKWLIGPYTRLYYRDRDYLKKFKPPGGKGEFETFQDFFIREFRELPESDHQFVWPCEGFLCEQDQVGQIENVNVKCDIRSVDTIFGLVEGAIPANYSFSNIFLHNKNYHRIHAPVTATVARIQHIPGDLVVLRPWIYKQNPSLPAFRNERYNMDLIDADGGLWYLSMVGGPAVGSIAIPPNVTIGTKVEKLQELAVFHLGSTCCMAAPHPPGLHEKNAFVEVGATY
jgi:phosphatidylserine decarboxylase